MRNSEIEFCIKYHKGNISKPLTVDEIININAFNHFINTITPEEDYSIDKDEMQKAIKSSSKKFARIKTRKNK